MASPDGRLIAYARGGSVWTSAIDGARPERLTDPRHTALVPTWSPDGRTVVFSGEETGLLSIGVDAAGRAVGKVRTLVASQYFQEGRPAIELFVNPRFSPDGTTLRYLRAEFLQGRKKLSVSTSIWTVAADGSKPSRLFRGSGDTRAIGSFDLSPDGSRIAFLATPTWKKEPRRLFVANADGSAPRLLATAAKGSSYGEVAWSPDGTSIAVSESRTKATDGAQLIAVDVTTGVQRTVARSARGPIIEVSWAPQPKG